MRILVPAILAMTICVAIAAPARADDPVTAALPDGPAVAQVSAACSGCHGIDQVTGAHKTRAQWEASVAAMIDRGAKVADADYDAIVDYLSKNFGPAAK